MHPAPSSRDWRAHCLSINAASMCGPIKLMRVLITSFTGRADELYELVFCIHRHLFDSGSGVARRPVIVDFDELHVFCKRSDKSISRD